MRNNNLGDFPVGAYDFMEPLSLDEQRAIDHITHDFDGSPKQNEALVRTIMQRLIASGFYIRELL